MNLRTTALAVGVAAALGLAGNAPAQDCTTAVPGLACERVMSGLANPRGMAFAPNGALYVAEAGRGGPDGPRCSDHIPNEHRCYGATGAVSRYWRGEQERVAEGLPSQAIVTATSAGTLAGGPQGIGFLGTGGLHVVLGLGGGPAVLEKYGDPLMGTLVHLHGSNLDRVRVVGDIALYEFDENPGSGFPDSNPFGVLIEPRGKLVVDAGGNTLLRVRNNGLIDTLAVFPPRPNPLPFGPRMVESVPTSVARGPDGELYVGELTGVPFPPGFANVYRVLPDQPPQVYCTGFKTIMSIAFARDGSLYVVEHASGGPFFPPNSGRLLRVGPAPACAPTVVLSGLDRPTAVVIGPDDAIYVTNHGGSPDQGEVLKVTP